MRVALLSLLFLCSCFHDVGRIPFDAPAVRETPVQLAAGDVRFWTIVDMRCKLSTTCEAELPVGGETLIRAQFSLPPQSRAVVRRATLLIGQ